ncbi:MAG: hypothetical protein AAGD05_03015, partial [Bacteroidota bacterium]
MKKCVFLSLVLLFVAFNLTANSPGGKSSGKPLLKGQLAYDKLISDWSTLPVQPVKMVHPDTVEAELAPAATNAAPAAQRFSFPELDEQIFTSLEEALPNLVQDNMDDLLNILPTAEEQAALQIIEAAQLGGTRVENFDNLLNLTLPAYRIQKIGNVEAIIVINSLKLTTESPAGGRLGIFVGVKIPQKKYDSEGRKKNITLVFGTEHTANNPDGGIKFTKEGGVSIGNIYLLNDVGFELGGSQRKAVIFLKKGTGTAGTYIKFNCDGVEEFSLDAEIHFSRDWLLPVDADGNPSGSHRVKGEFGLIVQDWNNILASVDIEHFTLTKWPEMSFALGNANIDLSDFSNPAGIKFPGNYIPPSPEGIWRGVYIETIEMTFPEPFKRKCDGNYGGGGSNGCRMKIGAKDLLVDNMGVSGSFSISGEARLASGALMNDRWNWSLDLVEIDISKSKFDGFTFNGGIVIPITKKETPFAYSAGVNFSGGQGDQAQGHSYYFNFQSVQGSIEFPLFQAVNVEIKENSMLSVVVANGNFKPSAVLNGSMSIGKGDPVNDNARIPSIEFKNIQLQTEGNFINGGEVFLRSGGNTLNNFPIQISDIGIGFGQNSVHLAFEMGLHLMKQEDGGLTANGDFKIYGKLITNVIGAHEWQFDRFEMSGFNVLIDLPAFKGCGTLSMFDEDPTYGKGFSAFLDARILGKDSNATGSYTCGAPVESAFSVQMAAVFGNFQGMRYFMIDGYVSSEQLGIPLPPTPLSLVGFGGGVQYRMKVAGYSETGTGGGTAIPAGMDTSGLIYEPDPNSLFGIKFAVGITTTGLEAGGGSPLNGKLSVIIRFGAGLSLQNITFWGTAELVNPVAAGGIQALPNVQEKISSLALSESERHQQDLDEVRNAQDKIMAKLGISLDFDGGFSYHGYAEVSIKAAQGKLTGSGQLDLLIDPNGSTSYPDGRWHLFIGGYENEEVKVPSFFDPENEITLYPVSVAIDYGGLKVVAKAYFLVGNDIPGPPDINPEAAKFFDISPSSNSSNRDLLYCGGNNPANGTGIAFGA